MENKSIVYTNENCIGCNKCIKVCSAIGACVSEVVDGKPRIEVDGSKCVACGSCIDVCVHGAREFEDDTERFFNDLKNGEQISLLLAPAFKANYPDEYESVLGGLKSLGVNRIISVSFGADITTWGYLNYISKNGFYGGISQPCPAVVSYIERYLPELIPKLFPVQSPLMCSAVYARKEMNITDRLAFISPCIAKKLEIEDPNNKGLVQYNVTFEHLMRYVKEHDIKGPSVNSEIEYGLGSFYPTPGGLAENVKWFLGDQVYIRQIEGEKHLYEWMHINAERIQNSKTPFLFIDALNCEKGCICGTAVNPEKSKTDDALYALLDIRENSKKEESGSAWSRNDKPEERLENYNRQFEHLNLNDYLRGYTDRSAECSYEIPTEKEFETIFVSMNKLTKESREINCTCCGYESCRQMATAIYNGFNFRENCLYYEKAMVHELEIEKTIAEEGERAKTAFLANMSHELRTPINAVLGMNEMILRESEDPDIKNYSEKIKVAGRSLLEMVNDILKYSKKQADRKDFEAEEKLPREQKKEETASKEDTSKKEESDSKKPYRQKFTALEAEVLAIDDTPMNLMVLKSLLKKTKIKIDTADSGDGGLKLSAAKKYDLLLFDHMMPEKDGIETLKELRLDENNPNRTTTAVCLTANAIPGAREFYIGAGFDDYLSKPVDPEKLEEMLLQYLPKEKVQIEAAPEAEPVKEAEEPAAQETGMFEGLGADGLIDVQKGIKNSGSADAYLPLLKIFYESMDDKAQELEGYYTKDDITNYTIKVHALKSSARLVGAEDVGSLAQELENAGKGGDMDYIKNNHSTLLKELMKLKDPLRKVLEKEGSDSKKPEADEYVMEEVYSQIKEAAQDMDCSRLEDIMDEMSEYTIPQKEADLFKKLKSAVGNYDYDTIASLLADK